MILLNTAPGGKMADWSFITNHGAVLAIIAQNQAIKAADIAAKLEITERSVRRVIADLCSGGYISKKYEGGVNHYKINADLPLRRKIQQSVKVKELLLALGLKCE
jgi:DeoR/GlpR family transcriptional regulator of sugar metabolism